MPGTTESPARESSRCLAKLTNLAGVGDGPAHRQRPDHHRVPGVLHLPYLQPAKVQEQHEQQFYLLPGNLQDTDGVVTRRLGRGGAGAGPAMPGARWVGGWVPQAR
jgi:hypothetical protein